MRINMGVALVAMVDREAVAALSAGKNGSTVSASICKAKEETLKDIPLTTEPSNTTVPTDLGVG